MKANQRRIGPDMLRDLVLRLKDTKVTPLPELVISDAQFPDGINLVEADTPLVLKLLRINSTKAVNLERARVQGRLTIEAACLDEFLSYRATFDDDLVLVGSTFSNQVFLNEVTIGGLLDLQASTVGKLFMVHGSVTHTVTCADLKFSRSNDQNEINIDKSTIKGDLFLDDMKLQGAAVPHLVGEDHVSLSRLDIAGDLSMRGSTIFGPINLSGTIVRDNAFLGGER